MNYIEKFIAWILGYDLPKRENIFIPDPLALSDEEFQKRVELGEEQKAQEVVLKSPSFNVDRIPEYKGETIKQFEFRPQTWEQFIGQREAKERATTILKKVARNMKAHFLVDGIKGHGKTTFVELLAKTLEDCHIIKRIGKQIDENNLEDIIIEINSCKNKNVMLFIDELDTMDWKVIKVLNPVIESFEIAGKGIRPFIFAGATINKNILINSNPDTLDRIPVHIKFARYNDKEIATILHQYWRQLYFSEKIPTKVFIDLAKNCKFNPRTAIGLLEEYIVEKDYEKVMRNCKIVKDGLTSHDIKLLRVLNEATRPMGANALAQKSGLTEREYLREFEPFLVEYDYINRIPSRIITDKGRQLLKELK